MWPVARRAGSRRLPVHLRDRGLYQSKHRIEVHRQRPLPLFLGHPCNGHILRRPDAVVRHQDVQPSERPLRLLPPAPPVRWRAQFLLDRQAALRSAAFRLESLGLFLRLAVAEGHPRSRLRNIRTVSAPIPREPPLISATFPPEPEKHLP